MSSKKETKKVKTEKQGENQEGMIPENQSVGRSRGYKILPRDQTRSNLGENPKLVFRDLQFIGNLSEGLPQSTGG